MKNQPDFTLFYDGHCPICQKEVAWLSWKNQKGRLAFQDIQDENFDPQIYGKIFNDFMGEIHGLYPDGRLIKGVEVFCAAYRAVGLGWLTAPMRWRLLSPVFDRLYALFARHRLGLGVWFGKKPCRENSCGFKSCFLMLDKFVNASPNSAGYAEKPEELSSDHNKHSP